MSAAAEVSAVKLNAHLWARHPDDYYIEPTWVSERLFEVQAFSGDIVDPACGSGRIVQAARTAGLSAWGADKVRRGPACLQVADFFHDDWMMGKPTFTSIISNPPFGQAERFAKLALEREPEKVALLLPSKWIHGDSRSRWLAATPLPKVLFLTPRPSMPPGPVIEAGIAPGGGKADFAWFIWQRHYAGAPETGWLGREA